MPASTTNTPRYETEAKWASTVQSNRLGRNRAFNGSELNLSIPSRSLTLYVQLVKNTLLDLK